MGTMRLVVVSVLLEETHKLVGRGTLRILNSRQVQHVFVRRSLSPPTSSPPSHLPPHSRGEVGLNSRSKRRLL